MTSPDKQTMNNPVSSSQIKELFGGFSVPNLYFPDSYVSQPEQQTSSDPKAELRHDYNSGTTTLNLDGEYVTSFQLNEFNTSGSSNGFFYIRCLINEALIRDGNDLYKDQARVSRIAGAAWHSTTDAIRQMFNDFNRSLFNPTRPGRSDGSSDSNDGKDEDQGDRNLSNVYQDSRTRG
ncbi:10737_t:CDS:2 [Paraglomus occultum]|uniref:10737_t:CDS:1 n=1 Tax=Paraglomus occultum TaxID=144539 RepID=A0A9N8YV97_9GLOM|nr:10737_t:CDS:2 [Paraglomus occultum]